MFYPSLAPPPIFPQYSSQNSNQIQNYPQNIIMNQYVPNSPSPNHNSRNLSSDSTVYDRNSSFSSYGGTGTST